MSHRGTQVHEMDVLEGPMVEIKHLNRLPDGGARIEVSVPDGPRWRLTSRRPAMTTTS
jgi:hypothetical protein